MQVTYCEQWSRHYSHPHKPLTEKQARERHRQGKLYTALLGDPAHCFLEFSAFRSVCVEFLDEALRSVLLYSFQEKQPNSLFLSEAIIRRYDADPQANSGYPNSADLYDFDVDGRLIIRHSVITPRATTRVGEEETTTDVTQNWEPFPEFGCYDGLATRDRGIPVLRGT
jgi:hypothetical protein